MWRRMRTLVEVMDEARALGGLLRVRWKTPVVGEKRGAANDNSRGGGTHVAVGGDGGGRSGSGGRRGALTIDDVVGRRMLVGCGGRKGAAVEGTRCKWWWRVA